MLTDTEIRLQFWRDGSTKAERLAAAALNLAGYEEIDPQSPLGGSDGKKDVLCAKGGLTWVGAVYFPNGTKRFSEIKKKFNSDLAGAPSHPQGFVFVTNQNITPRQRSILADITQESGKEFDILHLQKLVNLLDSAPGYGSRIQFLRIPMTIEEQLSWAVNSDSQTAKAISANTRELLALRSSLERVSADQSQIIRTLGLALPLGTPTPDLISVSSFTKDDAFPAISGEISPALILAFHRLTCFDLPSRAIGRLRTDDVWLGNRDGDRAEHIQPPAAQNVPERLNSLCTDWTASYLTLRSRAQKFEAMARFHAKFLVIHPFLDGNGRVARAVLMQQCLDLFGRADMSLMKKGADYYAALKSGDEGDYRALVSLIEPIVSG